MTLFHEPKFELGQTVMTRGIASGFKDPETGDQLRKEVSESFRKYCSGDWGQTCEEDSKLNDLAVANGDDRIVAKYTTCKGNIFIITEWDRSATTIMFADEY